MELNQTLALALYEQDFSVSFISITLIKIPFISFSHFSSLWNIEFHRFLALEKGFRVQRKKSDQGREKEMSCFSCCGVEVQRRTTSFKERTNALGANNNNGKLLRSFMNNLSSKTGINR